MDKKKSDSKFGVKNNKKANESGKVSMQSNRSYSIKEKEQIKKAQIQMIEDELFANKNYLEFGKAARLNKRDWSLSCKSIR